MKAGPECSRALTLYAWLTVVATVVLICFGGLVTSHGAGLAVPDWPNTYGYNMFLFPVSRWVGGIFYEHTHRLVASGVGLLTVILAVWMWRVVEMRWLRWLGVLAVGVVTLQGVLGGLRVTMLKDELGLVHGALAQSFLGLMTAIALFLTPGFWRLRPRSGFRLGLAERWLGVAVALVFAQLLLGAAMRHRHAGLAVPDFPLAYGAWWPPTDPASMARYNGARMEVRAVNDLEPLDIHLHMAHRLNAVLAAGVLWMAASRLRREAGLSVVCKAAWLWQGLVVVQILLGAWTVWSNKAADIATAHVAVGSLVLAVGVGLTLVCHRMRVLAAGDSKEAGVLEPIPVQPVSGIDES